MAEDAIAAVEERAPTRVSASDVIVKIVILFLVFMGVMAMFGNCAFPARRSSPRPRCPNAAASASARGPAPARRAGANDRLGAGGLGLVILLLAGDALVKGAVNLSLRVGIPALMVSLTIVAFGTSAPELLISINGRC